MRSLYLYFVVLIIILVKCSASLIRQEGATINYCNPKHVSECYAITRRSRRGEPYKTNITSTFRYMGGNNITIKVEMIGGIKIEVVKTRLCDVRDIDWLFEYLKTYSDMDGNCPYKAGTYGIYNMEFPPKNLPLRSWSLLNGNFHAKFYTLVTKTEEIIIECTIIFHIVQ